MPTLERLLAGPHPVVVVVTQPDRPRGRGRRRSPCPVAEVADRAGIPRLQPESASDPEFEAALRGFATDVGVVVAFGQFLPKRIREAPRLGYLINGHASLLPRLRGAAPIARAVLEGEAESGISVMRVEREMDAGAVALVRRTPLAPDETAGSLEARLADLSADAIAEALDRIAAGTITWTEQDHAAATFAPKLDRDEARLDWNEPAAALERKVRGFAPRPGAFTVLDGEPLRILAAHVSDAPVTAAPGSVACGGDPPLRIATGDGWLVPDVLQRAGKRALPVDAFVRGRGIPDGTRLGEPSTDATLRR